MKGQIVRVFVEGKEIKVFLADGRPIARLLLHSYADSEEDLKFCANLKKIYEKYLLPYMG